MSPPGKLSAADGWQLAGSTGSMTLGGAFAYAVLWIAGQWYPPALADAQLAIAATVLCSAAAEFGRRLVFTSNAS